MSKRKKPKARPTPKSSHSAVGSRSFTRGQQAARQPRRPPPAARRSISMPSWRGQRIAHLARAVPLAAWICALVAILNAFCWSIITPPFAVSDEFYHFAYVKQLAETHTLPSSHSLEVSPEVARALIDLHEFPTAILPATGAISSRAEQQKLEHDLTLAAEQPREGSNAAGVATSEPPLYYLLEAIPYTIASHGTLLTRLALMRLFSALFAGITAMFVFLFVREALPATRMAWIAGGLGVAFTPLLGFMSGAVNPDSLLFAVSAVLFWSLARAFRRGVTYRWVAVIGAITAVGLLTKLNFLGLFPGVILGLGILSARAARSSRSYGYRLFALGAGIAVSPVVLYAIVNVASNRPSFGLLSSATSVATSQGSIFTGIGDIWQVFLPRLPGMKPYYHGVFTARQIWFDGFVGEYGWIETAFPEWVYTLAAIFGVAVLAACVRTLVVLRETLRKRLGELAVYIAMSVGLLILIAGASYVNPERGSFTEARYLLPLLALFAAGLGLAIRAGGRRWEAALATLVVLVMLADNLFSQLLVIARFYS